MAARVSSHKGLQTQRPANLRGSRWLEDSGWTRAGEHDLLVPEVFR